MTKEEKEDLERQYISNFTSHFIEQKLDINNQEEINYIKETITNVVRLEIEELGYKLEGEEQDGDKPFKFELAELDDNKQGDHTKDDDFGVNRIRINKSHILTELSSDDREIRENSCMNIFSTIFHEVQHQRQEMLTKLNVSSKASMLYAKEFVMQEVLESEFYHNENYERFAIENNADAIGYGDYFKLMNLNNSDLLDYINTYKIDFELARYKGETSAHSQHFEFKDGIVREDLFEQIVQRPFVIGEKFLEKYPILKKEYQCKNALFKRKSTTELVRNLENEIEDISSIKEITDEDKQTIIRATKDMYYQMIFRSMQEEIPMDIDNFISERDISPLGYSEFYYKTEREVHARRENENGNKKTEIRNEIKKIVVEKKREQVLSNLIRYLGKDGFKDFLRRNGKKYSSRIRRKENNKYKI